MFKIVEIRKTIPQDLPTHWNIYKDDTEIASVWTNAADAQKICDLLNAAQ